MKNKILAINENDNTKWCEGCKEHDDKNNCCHRYSSFIRQTAKENKEFYNSELKECMDLLSTDGINSKQLVKEKLEKLITRL